MGRHAEGWKLHAADPSDPHPILYVRFRHEGVRYNLSTGSRDRAEAGAEAARLYAEVVSGERSRKQLAARGEGSKLPLAELTGQWISDYEAAHPIAKTGATLETYAGTWLGFFGRQLGDVTTESVERYTLHRLQKVEKETVRKERSGLRRFLAWCAKRGYLAAHEVAVIPTLDKSVRGTRASTRKREAVEVELADALRFIEALPVMSERSERKGVDPRPFPVRARFLVMWETGLRPITLSRLSVPEHFRKGATHLEITPDIDKVQYGRALRLSARARAALDEICPPKGLIFGEHHYRNQVQKAAKKASMPPGFSPYDLRHGLASHLLALGATLSGVGYVLGHRQATTTNRYVKMKKREGDRAIELTEDSGRDTGRATEKDTEPPPP